VSLFLPYTHIIKPKLKHIYLSIEPDGTLIVKSPKVSQRQIEKVILNRTDWINKTRAKILNKKGKPLNFQDNPTLYFLGNPYRLELLAHDKKKTQLIFHGEYFTLHYHHYDEILFQKAINTFYKEEAKKSIPPLVNTWAKKMQLFPTQVSFRKTRRQWGSCSSTNKLNFNTMMMKLPLSVIQYIIVHELAHIQHKHHQKSFWLLVAKYLPQYKEEIAQLKTYST